MNKERFEKIVEWKYPGYFLVVYVIVLLSFIQGTIFLINMSLGNGSSLLSAAFLIYGGSLAYLIFGTFYLIIETERKVYWRKLK